MVFICVLWPFVAKDAYSAVRNTHIPEEARTIVTQYQKEINEVLKELSAYYSDKEAKKSSQIRNAWRETCGKVRKAQEPLQKLYKQHKDNEQEFYKSLTQDFGFTVEHVNRLNDLSAIKRILGQFLEDERDIWKYLCQHGPDLAVLNSGFIEARLDMVEGSENWRKVKAKMKDTMDGVKDLLVYIKRTDNDFNAALVSNIEGGPSPVSELIRLVPRFREAVFALPLIEAQARALDQVISNRHKAYAELIAFSSDRAINEHVKHLERFRYMKGLGDQHFENPYSKTVYEWSLRMQKSIKAFQVAYFNLNDQVSPFLDRGILYFVVSDVVKSFDPTSGNAIFDAAEKKMLEACKRVEKGFENRFRKVRPDRSDLSEAKLLGIHEKYEDLCKRVKD